MGTKLYVGNLSFDTTEAEIRVAFEEHGEVKEVRLVLDRDTGRSRGFAFVTMSDSDGAQRAMEQMNGASLGGRPLRVNEAHDKRDRPGGGGGGGGGGRGGGDWGGGGGGGGRGGGGYGGGGERGGERGGRGGGDRRNRW
jgi:hypothetical protein